MSNVGRTIHGFCNGFFGRDSYHSKRIEAEGHDWIVARGVSQYDADQYGAEFASFADGWIDAKQRLINEWANAPSDD